MSKTSELFNDRKPRVGDPVTYEGAVVGKVLRLEGNLCWCDYAEHGPLPFIWRFSDGLNALHDWPGKSGLRS